MLTLIIMELQNILKIVTKTGGNKNAHGLVFYRQMTHVRYYK